MNDPDKWETLWPASDAPFDGQVESDKTKTAYTHVGMVVTFTTNAKLWMQVPGL